MSEYKEIYEKKLNHPRITNVVHIHKKNNNLDNTLKQIIISYLQREKRLDQILLIS